MKDTIGALQREFDTAELQADADTLRRLLADDFLSVGPKGFVLDKEEWVNRHVHFRYESLETSDMDIRLYGETAIVRTIQRNRATYKDQRVELAVRVTQVWVKQQGQWRMAAIQFSPLAED
jgi:ketosteroid isomerase-like protein